MTMIFGMDIRFNPHDFLCDGTGCDNKAVFQSRYVLDSWRDPDCVDLMPHGNFCSQCIFAYAGLKYNSSLLWQSVVRAQT